MRPIKFRGQDANNDWVYGYYFVLEDRHYIIHGGCQMWDRHYHGGACIDRFIEVIPETVGQFTGLCDNTKWKQLTAQEKQAWLDRGETKEATFTIMSKNGKIFRIKRVDSDYEHAYIELSDVQPGIEYQLKVKILPDVPVGRLHGSAKLYTSAPDQPEIEVKYYGRVRD